MDCEEQPMFDMEDDYGFYEDIDISDRSAVVAAHTYPTPTLSGLLDDVDDNTAPLSITCGSRIEDDNEDSLISSPPILSPFMVDMIVEDGLPWALQENQWSRLYNSSRDGESFSTFMRSVRGHGQTIIVAKTSVGRIIGGYATNVWSGRKQQSEAGSQGETNHSFLFAIEPPSAKTKHQPPISTNTSFIPGLGALGTSPTSALDFDFGQLSLSKHDNNKKKKPHVNIFKPSQKFKQVCQISNKMISMVNDDNNLSLSIENSFSRGVSCTRDDRQEEFTIVEFEVYSLED